MTRNFAYSTSYFFGLLPAGAAWVLLKSELLLAIAASVTTAYIFYKMECFRLTPNYLTVNINKVIYSVVQLSVIYSADEYSRLQGLGENIAVPLLIFICASVTGLVVMVGVGEYIGLEDEHLD